MIVSVWRGLCLRRDNREAVFIHYKQPGLQNLNRTLLDVDDAVLLLNTDWPEQGKGRQQSSKIAHTQKTPQNCTLCMLEVVFSALQLTNGQHKHEQDRKCPNALSFFTVHHITYKYL